MSRCNAQGCGWTVDDELVDDSGQPVPPGEQLRLHADDKAHPLCLLCPRSLRPGETRVCEKTLTQLQSTLRQIVELYALLPDELGHVRSARYDAAGGKGARGHALPGGAPLTMLGPGGSGTASRRLTSSEQARYERIVAGKEPVRWWLEGRVGPLPRLEYARLCSAAEGREHVADNLTGDSASVAWQLAEIEDDWRRFRGEPAAETEPTVLGAAGYLETHMRWASVSLDEDMLVSFAHDLRQLLEQVKDTAGRNDRPAVANTRCMECGGDLVQTYSPADACEHGRPPKFPARKVVVRRPDGELHVHSRSLADRRRLYEAEQAAWAEAHGGCDQGGRPQDWQCRGCGQTYTPEQYREAIKNEYRQAVKTERSERTETSA